MTRWLLLSAAVGACATPAIPPPPSGWLTEGPEAQVVLERRLQLGGDGVAKPVAIEFLERRLLRQATSTTVLVPTHPDREVTLIAAEIRHVGAPVVRLKRSDFLAVDRQRRPVGRGRDAAYLAAQADVPAGGLLSIHWRAVDRHAGFLPRLVLTGPAPVAQARIEVSGGLAAQARLTTLGLEGGILRSPDKQIATWRNLPPATQHPFAPGELAMRGAWLAFEQEQPPSLVSLLLSRPDDNFQLAALPLVSSASAGEPCLLRPWGAPNLRPDNALLTTAARKPEGGYRVQLPDAYRRRFADCTIVAPGAPARVPVEQPRGERLLRLRSQIGAKGLVETRGRLLYIGAAAGAVRRGQIVMGDELRQLLAPLAAGLVIGAEQRGATGPTQVAFSLRHRAEQLDPSGWLGEAVPELAYLPSGLAMAPLVASRRVEWIFEWAGGTMPPPATDAASVTHGRVAAASAWSLGPQRTLRFVRSLDWTPLPAPVDGRALRQQLGQMKVNPAPLPAP